MFILVYSVFLVLSFILISLGLFRPEHTELSLIGFVFLFLLALTLISGNITTVTGTITNSTFNYTEFITPSSNYTLLTSSNEAVENIYTPVSLDSGLAHTLGYWLAIGAFIGFLGIILSLKHSKGFR